MDLKFCKLRTLYINSAIARLSLNTFWVMMRGGRDEILIGRRETAFTQGLVHLDHPTRMSSLTIRNPVFDRSKMAKN